MLTQVKMQATLQELAKSRPVFHSEDDFKFALAWKIKDLYPRSDIRLEYPIRLSRNKKLFGSMYVDLLVTLGGKQFPIELKYTTRTGYQKKILELEFSGETFHLAGHGAENENRYRFWRDVWRIENSGFSKGYAIFLTNNRAYWQGAGKGRGDEAFRMYHGRAVQKGKTMNWIAGSETGKIKAFAKPIKLTHDYMLQWKNYSEVAECSESGLGKFECLLVEVKNDE